MSKLGAKGPSSRFRPRLYHDSNLPLIYREARHSPRRKNVPADAAEAQWRTRADLRLLHRRMRALAADVNKAYTTLRNYVPTENATLHVLNHPHLRLVQPITTSLVSVRGVKWEASLADLPALTVGAVKRTTAINKLAHQLVLAYERLELEPTSDSATWAVLNELIERRPLPPPPPPLVAAPPAAQTIAPPPPTLEEWVRGHLPLSHPKAWKSGVTARFRGESRCRWREPALIQAWTRGYQALSKYLQAGGLLSCPCCGQVIVELPPSTRSAAEESPA